MTIPEALLFLSRGVELSILVKATILVALGLTVAGIAGRARASFAARRSGCDVCRFAVTATDCNRGSAL